MKQILKFKMDGATCFVATTINGALIDLECHTKGLNFIPTGLENDNFGQGIINNCHPESKFFKSLSELKKYIKKNNVIF